MSYKALIAINVAVFLAVVVCSMAGIDIVAALAYHRVDGEFWQGLSYMFVHDGAGHIAANMAVLGAFAVVAAMLGAGRAILPLYLVGGAAGALAFGIVDSEGEILVGSSAAVLALVGAMAVWAPGVMVRIPFAGRVKLAVLAVAVILIGVLPPLFEWNLGVLAAHCGGIVAGVAGGVIFYRYGHGTIEKNMENYIAAERNRREVYEKLKTSGYQSLTDAEKKLL